MNRIIDMFEGLKARGKKALIGYLTAGDPDLKTSERNIRLALDHGLDLLELGIPFSDPTADGPAIQAAGQRALASGISVRRILDLAARLRQDYPATPIILFSYVNPLFRYGYAKLCRDAIKAGIDGFLLVDLPFEESDELRRLMWEHGLMFIQLIAPTTSPERARRLLAKADGFIYYIMVKGVTGARTGKTANVRGHLAMIRACTQAPIAVGFGIGTAQQARDAARQADAVVVGSALVQAAHEGRLATRVRTLARAVHS